ncbi:HDIG: uncharacterized domain HDIG [Rubrobacter radiotolerans]|uniref:HD domain-containing protein n=1 Tax=Rubrobacter radiotolerans TaxID=42256 RepID=A0A023WZI3_RUBRA|nr:HD domain-containing protein [Rubrobacter radiotolerans]AHY45488.1 HDIG: uncharacterized domain HDIG [Rubrobacter radiotolerans]MDX5892899.1 HD domain-containing protein [Rubrobacter radiotolerans]SMC02707.1 metal dependent phosphohydrolase [Rubrobacter radiotolerans DSM 5868]
METTAVRDIEDLVARAGTHPVWGYTHCLRVNDLAAALGREEGLECDAEVLRLAALLHDIGLYKAYNLREAPNHAERSAAVADRLLRDADFSPTRIGVVTEVVRNHQPGTRPAPFAESVLLNDAVVLDYLGSVGMSRVLAMVGLEPDVPDLASAVSHAEDLRRTLPNLLNLEASRELAAERVLEMDEFTERLRRATDDLRLL